MLPDVSMTGSLLPGDSRGQGRESRAAPARTGERPDDRELRSIAGAARTGQGLEHRLEQRDHPTGLVALHPPGAEARTCRVRLGAADGSAFVEVVDDGASVQP